jgi:DNA-directed RNA polymerase alpha subunit
MSEHAPLKIYEKDQAAFEKMRSLPIDALLRQSIDVLPFAARVVGYCKRKGIHTIGQLATQKKADLMNARNMGRKTVKHLEAYLGFLGLGLDGKLAATVPPPAPPAYTRGAQAMKLNIMAQLTVLTYGAEHTA